MSARYSPYAYHDTCRLAFALAVFFIINNEILTVLFPALRFGNYRLINGDNCVCQYLCRCKIKFASLPDMFVCVFCKFVSGLILWGLDNLWVDDLLAR